MEVYFDKTYARGFGTYPLKGSDLQQAVSHALHTGYRAFDTAQMYENEHDLGVALAVSGIDRGDLLITTKVHPDHYKRDDFFRSLERSLSSLRLDQLDVVLLHWPPIGGEIAPSLRLLAEAKKQGLTKHIGVSNFTSTMLRQAKQIIDERIVVNQVEFHPLLDQSSLLNASRETGIRLASYCSVARGEILKYPLLAEIGKKYGKSPVQVALRWILQKGVSINTMSTNPDNIKANFDIENFVLNEAEMDSIDCLNRANYRIVYKGIVPWVPEWD
ncbi:aldo/keto reductase [Brucella sp. NBRC 12950]|uniref:aldo/keto reductase n=1 Tax=Brucella sp. NBRC 12950 TaxID=2994518 RepID=UPI0024A18F39|nr:aldo/keto reductase [Brucella sp. NBRC 12950]GLU29829.1 oxidoreductase [Brucella sp. NBRC 12950]